ncbi:hypothetical protein [uncultured Sulfitobacter sp.]|uniref:hypothetical protein n=1 Tax=uncultured Sulfitobacter sp. TaxID=191468 RepID=UPI00260F32D7|nr:hypothetical protein [uncultured Sulfitobacter sp.]
MSDPYSYTSQGRRPATALVLSGIWALLLAAYLLVEASPVILTLVGLFTLPALYDYVTNPRATFTLDATHMRWQTPRQQADIAISEIDHLRFDTRLDMSVRLTVVRPSGVKIRVPYPATPPHTEFEPAARTAGLTTRRHHFSLLG